MNDTSSEVINEMHVIRYATLLSGRPRVRIASRVPETPDIAKISGVLHLIQPTFKKNYNTQRPPALSGRRPSCIAWKTCYGTVYPLAQGDLHGDGQEQVAPQIDLDPHGQDELALHHAGFKGEIESEQGHTQLDGSVGLGSRKGILLHRHGDRLGLGGSAERCQTG